ncbi:phosphotransferase family protein [Mycobacterium sp. CVI_P3]|uniref:Phosphotransferase family protein n=1 Tax=Mycobacterium pinniadriaticum TaxID=2994102 RepID=A0ABT3S7Z4_9MYCO|nr:phosphotransferase family protein [Mycobacterium pinniadriaticum]MCX2929187.1 phosphotransferase family protein [Mycobacterium pinniadriaticum]MCX2935612.1 phosphotransferase family protein [Mycobacterium pinniadriaticum]
MTGASSDVADRLTSWLRTQLPDAEDVAVEGLDRVDFGHSAEMLSLTIVTHERADVVLRLRPRPPALLEPYDLARQFRILSALRPTAVRSPNVLWLEESGSVLGRPFLVMQRVPGDVYEMQAPQAATDAGIRRMCEGMAEQLAAVHNVDLQATGLDALGDGRDHLDREIAHWADEMHRVRQGPLPALERLLVELQAGKPDQYPTVTLVHGDAKPGNFAFVADEVSAVFDWELTGVGDPLTDLGWMELLWMQPVGITSHPAALSFEEFLAHYQAASGITPRNRPWYRALNAFKMAVICLIGSMLYDSGASDDERFVLNAHGISPLTQLGLAELGVTEQLEDGPVLPRPR